MQRNTSATSWDLQQTYLEKRQAIELRLRTDIDHFRRELDKLDPHSGLEADRWSASLYHKLVERRTKLLNTLFPETCQQAMGSYRN